MPNNDTLVIIGVLIVQLIAIINFWGRIESRITKLETRINFMFDYSGLKLGFGKAKGDKDERA